MDELAVGFV